MLRAKEAGLLGSHVSMACVGLVGTPGLVIVTNLNGHAFSDSQFSFVFAVLSLSYSVRILSACCSDFSAVDDDVTTIRTLSASADSGTRITEPVRRTSDSFYGSSVYRDGSAVTTIGATDSGSTETASCVNVSAVDGDVSATARFVIAADSGKNH